MNRPWAVSENDWGDPTLVEGQRSASSPCTLEVLMYRSRPLRVAARLLLGSVLALVLLNLAACGSDGYSPPSDCPRGYRLVEGQCVP